MFNNLKIKQVVRYSVGVVLVTLLISVVLSHNKMGIVHENTQSTKS